MALDAKSHENAENFKRIVEYPIVCLQYNYNKNKFTHFGTICSNILR